MGNEPQDSGKRRTLKTLLFTVPTLIIPFFGESLVHGFDFRYAPYTQPDSTQVKAILSKNNYPETYDFCYGIPYNTDAQGNTAGGNIRITKNPEAISVIADIIHLHENKTIELVEKRTGNLFDYMEREIIFDQNGVGRVNYMTHIQRPLNRAFNTPLSLIDMVFGGKIKDKKFRFYGEQFSPREYRVDEKETQKSDGVEMVTTEIKDNDPRLKGVTVFYKIVNGHKFPVEFHVRYDIKLPYLPSVLGANMDEHTLRIVLEDSAM